MHFKISMIKSVIRIVSCCISALVAVLMNSSLAGLLILAGGFGIAELLGILEEAEDGKQIKK